MPSQTLKEMYWIADQQQTAVVSPDDPGREIYLLFVVSEYTLPGVFEKLQGLNVSY